MTTTPNLGLPFIEAAQAQKHVTHNEAIGLLDAIVMLSVHDRDLSAPPASPATGDRYIVKPTGSGAFVGQDNRVASYADSGWTFITPRVGWVSHVEDENTLILFDGTSWQPAIATLQDLARLGVGGSADATNPFLAKLNNALWTAMTTGEGGTGDLRVKLNKEAAGRTLSILMQTAYSGRAEIGLAGDDDFHFKVSPDGSSWAEALRLDRGSGAATCLGLTIGNEIKFAGDITPAQITANQNDYDPAGLATAAVLRLTADAPRTLTGIARGARGRLLVLANVGANAITLANASAASSGANRFATGADVAIAAHRAATLLYDATDSRWRLIALS